MSSPQVLFAGLSTHSIAYENIQLWIKACCMEDVGDLPKLSCTSFWRLLKSMGFSHKKKKLKLTDKLRWRNKKLLQRHTFFWRESRQLLDSGRPSVVLYSLFVKSCPRHPPLISLSSFYKQNRHTR